MSAEEAVTEALQTPVDQNAQAAEEAKQMLAELEGAASTTGKVNGSNGVKDDVAAEDAAGKDEGAPEKKSENTEAEDVGDEARERRQDRGRDRRDRRDRNGGGRDYDRGNRGGFKHRNYRDNIKSDLTTQEITDDPAKIREQVEFYFSDSNLPTDKFLFEKAGGIANIPIELKELCKFKRMRRFQPFEAIVEALRDSDKVELTDNDTCVRRKTPLPENFFEVIAKDSDERSVYAKGFGEENSNTQFDVEAFFRPFGPIRAVRLRRTFPEKLFKGSVFVEFQTKELAETFLSQDPKPKYDDKELQIMSKVEYMMKKKDELDTGKTVSNGYRSHKGNHDRRGSYDGKRKRDGEDTRDWKTRREEDQKRGFRNDRGRGDRFHGGRGGKGHGGGRSRGPETDDRGIPTVKSTNQDALAKAKAAVEANKKQEQDEQKTADDGAASPGLKRAREDDGDDEVSGEPEAKKVDTKSAAEPVEVES